ncbi:hypothetical protein DFP72DRAFT_860603 [Ephemerocybe angulata]|uniref:Uncharacterized protein n=1 Tax=Ephemerocybe angulata TaxID=980116 RepID=A0A8H6LU64_9AGAR|nr:hypothetical protein DFP72DRAFT_860603 [Tulosesus angulatus]
MANLSPNANAARGQQLRPSEGLYQFALIHPGHHTDVPAQARNPGCLRGSSSKLAVQGPKPQPRHPRGSGKHQLEMARRAAAGLPVTQEPKKRGRPRKDANIGTSVKFG